MNPMVFEPSRWQKRQNEGSDASKYMMHFSAGSRQCIGKVLALTIMNMVACALLAEFNFKLADPAEQQRAENGDFKGQSPSQYSVGISELKESNFVKVTRRKAQQTP
jgi:cytochrome P450